MTRGLHRGHCSSAGKEEDNPTLLCIKIEWGFGVLGFWGLVGLWSRGGVGTKAVPPRLEFSFIIATKEKEGPASIPSFKALLLELRRF